MPTTAARRYRTDCASAYVERLDRFELRLDLSSMSPDVHANGWVDVWGVATRVGVFVYEDNAAPGGEIREYRPPEEVMRDDSLTTLDGVPFTIDHPLDPVDSGNFRDLAHGHVLQVRPEGSLVLVRIRIATDDAKAAVKSGTVELSCGYTVRLDESPGITPNGEPYDAVHRDIRYNHLALVDLARAGPVARLKLDTRGGRVQRLDQTRRGSEAQMFKITIDGKTYSVHELLVPGISAKADEAGKAVRRGDMDTIETASVTFESPDGKVELVLPMGTIEEMLAMIGAVEGAAPAEPEPTDAEPPVAEPAVEDPLATPLDEEEDPIAAPLDEEEDTPKADLAKLVADAVAKAVPAALKAREDRARERSELERRCAPHLSAGYRFDKADDFEIVCDTIEAVSPDRADAAKALAKLARGGDLRAHGRLDAMLEHEVAVDRDDSDDTGKALATIYKLRETTDEAAPTMSRADRIRSERLRRLSGDAPIPDAS